MELKGCRYCQHNHETDILYCNKNKDYVIDIINGCDKFELDYDIQEYCEEQASLGHGRYY